MTASLAARPRVLPTVLFVERDLASLALVEQVMRHVPGVRLVPLMQGHLAVELAHGHCPALILLDTRLLDADGDQVLADLRADPRTAAIPVVTMSPDATDKEIERFRAAGAVRHLCTPFDLDDLVRTISEYAPAARPRAGGGERGGIFQPTGG